MLNYQRVPQNPQLFSDHSFFVGDSGWMACGAFKRQIRADGSCNMSNGSCATRSDWLVIGCFKKRWNIYRSSHFLFDYIDMTYIFIWRYDLYDLYEDMTSSPQSIGMIVPGSLERLNHKNNLKKNSNEFFEFLVLTQYLEIFGTTCCKNGSTIVPSGGPASSWLSIDLAELMEKVGAKMKDCHCFS